MNSPRVHRPTLSHPGIAGHTRPSAVERGILLPAGTVLGMDEGGQSVSETADLVVLDLIHRRDSWLVRYMTLSSPLAATRR